MVYFSLNRITGLLLVIFITIFFSNCEDISDEALNNELIFPEANEIKVPSYVYQAATGDIFIHGDEGFKNNIVDTITSTPQLRWDSVQTRLIFSAMFINPVQVAKGKIENTNDIIWIWHSGLDKGKDGWVTFEEGRSISDGVIENPGPPVPLPAAHQYYWGVWSWDDSGIRVLYSSRQMIFYVK